MKKCTNLLMIIGFWVISFNANSQAKKPTLMILPSDNWCQQRYFMTEFDNQGTKQKVPNYKQSFQEDTEIGQVISKLGSLMIDRGFPLKDAEQELKAIEARSAEDNMRKLLLELNDIDQRSARFQTSVCLILGGREYLFEGTVEGSIAHAPQGEGGFGYDPLFIPAGYGQSFAEMTLEQKNQMSHRGRAIAALREFLLTQRT